MGRMDRALHRGARRVIKAAGEQVMLIRKTGEKVSGVWAHISRDIEYTEGETQTSNYRDEVEMLVAEVCNLVKGDVLLTETGDTWTIEKRLSNDGYTVSAVVMDRS